MLVRLRDEVSSALHVPPVHFCDSWITSSVSKGEPILWLWEGQKTPEKNIHSQCSLGDEFVIHNPLKVRKNKKVLYMILVLPVTHCFQVYTRCRLFSWKLRDPALITSDDPPWKICVTLKTELGVGVVRKFEVCQERKVQTAAAGSCPDISRETTFRGRAGHISIRWAF